MGVVQSVKAIEVFVRVFVLLLILSCATLTPKTGEGTDYPCGYDARVCQVSNICCPEGSDCPGTYSCPANEMRCCGHVEQQGIPPNPPLDQRPIR